MVCPLNSNLILLIPINNSFSRKSFSTLNSNLILLIPEPATSSVAPLCHFKFQSDSINTGQLRNKIIYRNTFKFQSDSINTELSCCTIPDKMIFKFQSDSINTTFVIHLKYTEHPLNSNLILLIRQCQIRKPNRSETLNSNLILLILIGACRQCSQALPLNSNLILLIPIQIFQEYNTGML